MISVFSIEKTVLEIVYSQLIPLFCPSSLRTGEVLVLLLMVSVDWRGTSSTLMEWGYIYPSHGEMSDYSQLLNSSLFLSFFL